MSEYKYLLTEEDIWMDGFDAGYKAGQEFVLTQIANEDDITGILSLDPEAKPLLKRLFNKNECEDTKSTNTKNTD